MEGTMFNGGKKLGRGGVATLAALAGGGLGCGSELDATDTVAREPSAIVNGTPASAAQNPGTVAVYHQFQRPCSGTLLRPNWVLTARHCLTVDNEPWSAFRDPGQIWIGPPDAVNPTNAGDPEHAINPGFYPPSTAIQAMQFVEYQPRVDLALVRLWSPMEAPREPSCDPSSDPYCVPELSPPLALGLWNGETSELVTRTVRIMGYGKLFPEGAESNGTSGAGRLRYGDVAVSSFAGIFLSLPANTGIPQTASGDSGGSAYTLNDTFGRNLFGLAGWTIATFTEGSTATVRSWIKRTISPSGGVFGGPRPDIALVGGPWSTFHWASSLADGSFNRYTASGYGSCDPWGENCTSFDLSSFAWSAQQPGVKPVAGDFTGDGLLDIVLVGALPYELPMVSSMADGTQLPSYTYVGVFASTAQSSGALPLSGDFNGDGRSDIALVRGNDLTSIPVAFSSSSPGPALIATDTTVDDIPALSRVAGAKSVSGDFDGDGRDDIAVVGGSGWTSIPIAHSNGDGSFVVTNQFVSDFPGWAAEATGAVAGDFNGDGRDDIALTGGSGWNTLPVAFSTGGGNFLVKNQPVSDFAGFAQESGAKPVAGDFDGDGREDVALTGGAWWNTLPVAFSFGDGGFRVTNSSAGTFPSLAQEANATPVVLDSGVSRRPVHAARDAVAGRHTDGRLEIFFIGTNDQLYRNQQLAAGSSLWSGEIPLGATAKRIALGQNDDGRLELFFIGGDDAIYHLYEWDAAVNGGWYGPEALGGWAKELAVTRDQDGRLQLFTVGTNDYFYTNAQSAPNSGWNGEQFFGGAGKRLALETNLAGGLELYVIGTDDAIYRNYQPAANASFTGWTWLGGNARELAVGRHQDGRFQVFYIAGDGAASAATSIRTIGQLAGGDGSWSDDGLLPVFNSASFRATQLRVGRTTDDRLSLMWVAGGGSAYEYVQTSQNGAFPDSSNGFPVFPMRSIVVVPASAYGPSENLYLGWDDAMHGESSGSGPGNRRGDRQITDTLGDQTTKVCGEANEGESFTLSCPAGTRMVGQQFISYGTPNGSCGSGTFSFGSCNASVSSSYGAVYAACLGKESCTLTANNDTFGDPCSNVYKRLYVVMYCL